MPENSDAYAFCQCPFQGGQNGANASTPDPPEAGQGCALPYHAKMCSEAAQVSTEQLIDELRAIAGNDGERVNTIEGRETAAQYARRVQATLVEREAKEREQRASAMEELKTVDLRSHSGCSRGAQLLCGALAEHKAQRKESAKSRFQEGDRVRITAGLFAGRIGRVEKRHEKGGVSLGIGPMTIQVGDDEIAPL